MDRQTIERTGPLFPGGALVHASVTARNGALCSGWGSKGDSSSAQPMRTSVSVNSGSELAPDFLFWSPADGVSTRLIVSPSGLAATVSAKATLGLELAAVGQFTTVTKSKPGAPAAASTQSTWQTAGLHRALTFRG